MPSVILFVFLVIEHFLPTASFKIISLSALPVIHTPHNYIHHSPHLHFHRSLPQDPLVLLSISATNKIRILNLVSLPSRKPPPFPDDAEMIQMAQRMTLSESREEGEPDVDDGPMVIVDGHPELEGWDIAVNGADTEYETIEACAMGLDGTTIVGVGSRGSTWIWVEERVG
jgi:hypothetical protein